MADVVVATGDALPLRAPPVRLIGFGFGSLGLSRSCRGEPLREALERLPASNFVASHPPAPLPVIVANDVTAVMQVRAVQRCDCRHCVPFLPLRHIN